VKGPAPTREAHDRFCRIEGWTLVRGARGKEVGHHVTYELPLLDGNILRTRVSRPVNRDTYGQDMWHHILRSQLAVDEGTFWACVNHSEVPDRSIVRPIPTESALPLELAGLLKMKVGLSDAEVATMNKNTAVDRLNRFWESGD
jgi:hypothetical protein